MIGGHNGPCAIGPAGACRLSDKPDGNCEVYNGRCRMTDEYKKRHTPKKRPVASKAAPFGATPTAAELEKYGSFANWSLAAAAARQQASKKVASPKKASPKKAAAYKPTKQGVCPLLSSEDCVKHPACSWIAPKNKKIEPHCRHTKYLRGGNNEKELQRREQQRKQQGGHNGPCAIGPAGACRLSDKPDGNCEVYNGRCRMTDEYKKRHTPKKRPVASKAAPFGATPTAAELEKYGSFANWSLAAAAARQQASKKVASPKKASPKKAAAYKPTKQGVCPLLSSEDCVKHPACSWIAPKNKKIEPHCRHTKYLRGGYSKIYNPATGRDVNVLSSEGEQILKGYINKLNGGY